jgi:hypothetical protein
MRRETIHFAATASIVVAGVLAWNVARSQSPPCEAAVGHAQKLEDNMRRLSTVRSDTSGRCALFRQRLAIEEQVNACTQVSRAGSNAYDAEIPFLRRIITERCA